MYVLRCLVVSDSLWLLGLQPTRLLCPWNFPCKSTGMGCRFLLQGIFPTQGSKLRLLHLLHWQADSFPLAPPEKSYAYIYYTHTHIYTYTYIYIYIYLSRERFMVRLARRTGSSWSKTPHSPLLYFKWRLCLTIFCSCKEPADEKPLEKDFRRYQQFPPCAWVFKPSPWRALANFPLLPLLSTAQSMTTFKKKIGPQPWASPTRNFTHTLTN